MTDAASIDILIDANLLILLVVGLVDPAQISRHKNTSRYSLGDFTLLTRILASARTIVVTPNVTTEASNLLRQTSDPLRTRLGLGLSGVLAGTREVFILSDVAAQDPIFARLGLTDVAILKALSAGLTLLTDDTDLYLAAAQRGLESINFSHHRAASA